jgi:hypothetical protein
MRGIEGKFEIRQYRWSTLGRMGVVVFDVVVQLHLGIDNDGTASCTLAIVARHAVAVEAASCQQCAYAGGNGFMSNAMPAMRA